MLVGNSDINYPDINPLDIKPGNQPSRLEIRLVVDAGDDEAETYECLGIAPCSLDCHGEADGWAEARSFAAVRARELKRKAKVYGIPSGGALVARSGGKMHARGEPVPVFAALPRRAATIERKLRAEKT